VIAGPAASLSALASAIIRISPDCPTAATSRSLRPSPLTKKLVVSQCRQGRSEGRVLAKRRCPHTGIVNFFCDVEPFLAVGSITKVAHSQGCVWRSYIGEEEAGLSADMATAELRLAGLLLSEIGNRSTRMPRLRARDWLPT
jgi:hypothetical protein